MFLKLLNLFQHGPYLVTGGVFSDSFLVHADLSLHANPIPFKVKSCVVIVCCHHPKLFFFFSRKNAFLKRRNLKTCMPGQNDFQKMKCEIQILFGWETIRKFAGVIIFIFNSQKFKQEKVPKIKLNRSCLFLSALI